MSVVFASNLDCGEWGSGFNQFAFRQDGCLGRHVIPDYMSNMDGYTGNPTSFVDINDPIVIDAQKKHEARNREEFRKNIHLVAGLIQKGVVMPTDKLVMKSVENLRKIASGKP